MRSLPRYSLKIVLRGLFVISTVFILSLSGPPNLLLAQQDPAASPSATPIPDDYWNNLPICPDYVLTPSIEPTPMGNGGDATPTCRLSPDSQTYMDLLPLYEQGYDLSALGFADPDPESAQLFPFLTPVAQAASGGVTQTTDELVLQGKPRTYLPLLQNDADPSRLSTEPAASTTPTVTLVYTSQLNHPYIPFDQLPECEDTVANVSDTTLPDFNAPQCRAKTVAYIDLKALYDKGVDLQKLGFGDPPRTASNTSQESEMGQAAVNGTPTTSWAQYDLTVPAGYSGISNIFGVASGKTPTLAPGFFWQNYHYYNRLQMGSSSVGYCGQLSKLALGIAYGTFDSTTITSNPTLVWERYTYQGCGMTVTGTATTNSLRLYIVNVAPNRYLGEVWLNGQWVVVFNEYVNWGLGTRVAGGHQLWARYQDKHNIRVPTNFTSQLALNDYPWADRVFLLTRPELNGVTIPYIDYPFNVMDIVGPNNKSYTSISISAN